MQDKTMPDDVRNMVHRFIDLEAQVDNEGEDDLFGEEPGLGMPIYPFRFKAR
jgi:hypothetical protein